MNEHADPGMTPIRISEVASMFRTRVDVNERPFTLTVIKHNNSLVDEWYEKVLLKIADKQSNVRSGQVYGEWQFFYFGKTINSFMELYDSGLVGRPDEKVVDFWVKTFTKKDIADLAAMGAPVVGHGWKILTDENYIRSCLDKWEKVYKGSDDPLVWRKKAHNNPKLWAADYDNCFWDTEEYKHIYQKVMTVLKIEVRPK